MKDLKAKYNKVLLNYYRAADYMDNQEVPVKTREKHIPRFKAIIDELNRLLKIFREGGINYSDTEALNGFYLDDKVVQ